jgi:hypothetical protein
MPEGAATVTSTSLPSGVSRTRYDGQTSRATVNREGRTVLSEGDVWMPMLPHLVLDPVEERGEWPIRVTERTRRRISEESMGGRLCWRV